jgi:hypothetical protein
LALAILAVLVPIAAARTVRYHGLRIAVPAGWPVINLSSDPRACVRFNRHAVYLGTPSAQQQCPAHAVGRTDAILVQPLAAGVARAGAAAGSALPGGAGSSGALVLPRHGVVVTATWSRSSRLVRRALGRRSLRPVAGGGGARVGQASAARARAAAATPRRRASTSGVYTGLGFDACSAPSTTTMTAWGSSPYRAVGVYLGGASMACSQPNLTSAWVTEEIAAGWHLIPTYVGLQGYGSCGGKCADITPSQAAAQGTAAASDAATHAQALGIGPGNPIYDDMEGYARGGSHTTTVLAYLSAWTAELHSLGYLSGVYSSADSGIADLVAAQGSPSFVSPDDLWVARWNHVRNTVDPVVPSTEWADHQRIHQYAGGHDARYGRYVLNIDSDYVDGATVDSDAGTVATCAPVLPDRTFVQVSGTFGVYVIAGGAPLFVSDWNAVGGQQAVDVITQQVFDALCAVPQDGTFLGTTAGAFYRVAGGAPLLVSDWTPFGGPQPYVTIDPWDIANAGNPASHLVPMPIAGTVVKGLPSSTYWLFGNSYRTPAGQSSRAVAVGDSGLLPFKIAQCSVPSLKHLTFPKAKKAIRKAHCTLGKVRRPKHWSPHHALRVYWQIPRAKSAHTLGWKIGIRMR